MTTPRAILSGSIVGHVRFASPNIETCLTNTPLYVMGEHIWTINGLIEPWPGPISRALRARLDGDHEADLRGATDAEMMGALWRTCYRRIGGRDAAGALRSMIRQSRDIVRENGGEMKTTVILGNATEILALRYADRGEPNTLYCLEGEPRWHGGFVIASEALDDGPGWREVPPSMLLRVDRSGMRLEPLELDGARTIAAKAG